LNIAQAGDIFARVGLQKAGEARDGRILDPVMRIGKEGDDERKDFEPMLLAVTGSRVFGKAPENEWTER
jgi:hypothetical protein